MISKKAARQLYDVIKRHVIPGQLGDLIDDLRHQVTGNQSYCDTLDEVLRLYNSDPGDSCPACDREPADG